MVDRVEPEKISEYVRINHPGKAWHRPISWAEGHGYWTSCGRFILDDEADTLPMTTPTRHIGAGLCRSCFGRDAS